MGFFTPRKPEETSFLDHDRSVVQVIRSRLVSANCPCFSMRLYSPAPHCAQYGKYRGKHRNTPTSQSSRKSASRRSSERDSQRSRSPRSPLRPQDPTLRQMPRAHTDVITSVFLFPTARLHPEIHKHSSTLAQRLNELAIANSEGLLR